MGADSPTGSDAASPYTVHEELKTKCWTPALRSMWVSLAVAPMLLEKYFSGAVTLSPTALSAAK